jgi:hypothetical protein
MPFPDVVRSLGLYIPPYKRGCSRKAQAPYEHRKGFLQSVLQTKDLLALQALLAFSLRRLAEDADRMPYGTYDIRWLCGIPWSFKIFVVESVRAR